MRKAFALLLLLLAILFSSSISAAEHDYTGAWTHPNVPASHEVALDPPAGTQVRANQIALGDVFAFTGNVSISAPFLPSLIDDNTATVKTWSDPNGGGVGTPANRSGAYIFRTPNLVATDGTSVANGAYYFGGQLTCLSGAECHHGLAYPIIVRGTGGNFKDVLTGWSFAAPVAPSGDASNTTAGIAASVSFESNPPSSWVTLGCTGCLNTFQTAQTNLGQNTFNVLIKSGGLALGSAINLLATGNGIRQGVGDLEINNFDTTAAGTITFYNAGVNKSRMSNAGAWTHTNSATWNYSIPSINLNGTEGSARNWTVRENAGNLEFVDVSSGAVRGSFQAPGNNAFFTANVGYAVGSNSSVVLISATAPTIAAAGCGGGAASIVVANGTAAFKVNVGTTPTSACTLTFPTATTGWNVTCNDITTQSASVFVQKQTGAESQTSVTITNFNTSAAATAFVASDVLKCTATAD